MTWGTAQLGEIATIQRESVLPSQIKDDSRYVGLEHIESGGAEIRSLSVKNGDLVSNKFRFGPNHVLYGKLRPNLSKVACPNFEGICSTDILPILAGPKLHRRYLLHFLLRPEIVIWASSRATGINLPRLSPRQLAGLPISFPPINEQRRIAFILDRADALRGKRKRALDLLNALPDAIYKHTFGDPVKNLRGVPKTTLGDLGVKLTYGPRFYNKNYCIDGVRIARITDLSASGELDFDAMPKLSLSFTDINMHRSRPGELIFARTGATVGKVALIKEEDPISIPGAYFIRMIFPENVNPSFAWYTLRSSSIQAIISEQSRQSAQQNFSGPGLRRLPFLLPPFAAQLAFSEQVAKLESVKLQVKEAQATLDDLFTSLQHRAFSGQL